MSVLTRTRSFANAVANSLGNELAKQHNLLASRSATDATLAGDLKTLLNAVRTSLLQDQVLNSTGLGRGSTTTNVATGAFDFQIGATAASVNTFKKKVAVGAGTALAAGTIPQDKWGIYLFTVGATGTIASVAGAANFTTGYADEASALLAIPAPAAANAVIGYVTVQTKTGFTFVGGTDALAGGAVGNIANATNYYEAGSNYNAVALGGSLVGAAVSSAAAAAFDTIQYDGGIAPA